MLACQHADTETDSNWSNWFIFQLLVIHRSLLYILFRFPENNPEQSFQCVFLFIRLINLTVSHKKIRGSSCCCCRATATALLFTTAANSLTGKHKRDVCDSVSFLFTSSCWQIFQGKESRSLNRRELLKNDWRNVIKLVKLYSLCVMLDPHFITLNLIRAATEDFFSIFILTFHFIRKKILK